MSAPRALDDGIAFDVVRRFVRLAGSSDEMNRRPKTPLNGESRSHQDIRTLPALRRSKIGKYFECVTIRWSRHCATLQRFGSDVQLSCAAPSAPNARVASSLTWVRSEVRWDTRSGSRVVGM